MGKDVFYTLKRGTKPNEEQIAMIEAAESLPVESDCDNPAIDPETTPEQYEALMKAVAERNRRIVLKRRGMA